MIYPAHLNMVREVEQMLEQLKEQVYDAYPSRACNIYMGQCQRD